MKKGPFTTVAQEVPDVVQLIFSFLPKSQYLPQRLLSRQCRRIIDSRLLNKTVQGIIPFHIDDSASQQALFEQQQREIESLLRNKSKICSTPKWQTQVVRPAPELVKAFDELTMLPAFCSLFTLYRRHIVLNAINLHIILNSRDYDVLSDMFMQDKVIDLSGLYLTRLPHEFFNLFIDKRFYAFPTTLDLAHNCLTSLPEQMTLFTNLKAIDVSGNPLEQKKAQSHSMEKTFKQLKLSS